MAARDAVPGGEHARALHVVPARLGGPKREVYGVRPWADASVLDLVGVTAVLLHHQPVTRVLGYGSMSQHPRRRTKEMRP